MNRPTRQTDVYKPQTKSLVVVVATSERTNASSFRWRHADEWRRENRSLSKLTTFPSVCVNSMNIHISAKTHPAARHSDVTRARAFGFRTPRFPWNVADYIYATRLTRIPRRRRRFRASGVRERRLISTLSNLPLCGAGLRVDLISLID